MTDSENKTNQDKPPALKRRQTYRDNDRLAIWLSFTMGVICVLGGLTAVLMGSKDIGLILVVSGPNVAGALLAMLSRGGDGGPDTTVGVKPPAKATVNTTDGEIIIEGEEDKNGKPTTEEPTEHNAGESELDTAEARR